MGLRAVAKRWRVLRGAGGRATRSELDRANWAPASEAQVKSVMVCPGTQPIPPAPQQMHCQHAKTNRCT